MKLAADLRGANVDGQTKSLESEKVDAPVIDTIEQIRPKTFHTPTQNLVYQH